MSSAPVVIAGAGLAGLNCAVELRRSGRDVRVFEASDGIGGRARTDSVEGFRLDRGFQVLLTAYPEARRALSYEGLRLGKFVPGARVRAKGSFSKFADPVRVPGAALGALVSPVAGIGDLGRLFRMKRDLVRADPREIMRKPDLPAIASLEERGFSTRLIESFFRPFFGGVLLDPDLVTSSRLLEIFFRCFALGSATLPAGGIGSIADQLAANLPLGTINLNSPVSGVSPAGIELENGRSISASAVVVATEEGGASKLCEVDPPNGTRSTTCIYFDAPEVNRAGDWLALSGEDGGPVNEVAFPSSVAADYAPPDRSLVSVSVVGDQCRRPDLLDAVRDQLAEWFGRSKVETWRHLRTYEIDHGLPAFPPGRVRQGGLPPLLDSGVFVCGDYRETPSIQGALVSGRKTAEAVSTRL